MVEKRKKTVETILSSDYGTMGLLQSNSRQIDHRQAATAAVITPQFRREAEEEEKQEEEEAVETEER